VAKILVADDNSNIQKMVGLALKDQGIDVVAVGNGEAAVRKASDILPDLVLADVFMPVRNGYEVCEYIKNDPALKHIPVILLVGAFDPLDEQEAQRVGADGVLKKPFVPPDPLIAMVKAALARAGVSLTAKNDKTAKFAERKAAEMVAAVVPTEVVPLPMSVAPPAISIEETEGLVEEVSVKPAAVTMEGGAPLAFGNLLGTSETAEEDPAFMTPAPPERDWRAKEEEEEVDVPEEEEEEEPKNSWRRDADMLEEPAATGRAVSDWRDTAFAEPPSRKSARENWEMLKEVPVGAEAATRKDASVISEQPEVATRATKEVLAAEPARQFSEDSWAAAIAAGTSGTGLSEEAKAAAKNWPGNGAPLAAEVAGEALVSEREKLTSALPVSSEKAVRAATATQEIEHAAVSSAIDRFAVTRESHEDGSDPEATTEWEVQAKQKDLLAATWDTPAAKETTAVEAAVAMQAAAEPVPETIAAAERMEEPAAEGNFVEDGTAVAEEPRYYETIPEVAAAEPAAVVEAGGGAYAATEELAKAEEAAPTFEAATAYVADVTLSEADPVQAEPAAEIKAAAVDAEAGQAAHGNTEVSSAESALKAAVLNAANGNSPGAHAAGGTVNDDLVARVLANLSPEVLQAVTRQILKPVVEAMVREELNKKP
jgi:CheY-like chemotaxis protein